MKKTFLLLLLSVLPAFGAWPNGYTYRLTEAIDYTKVGTADHTDYPATYIRTYAELAHTTHGGYATDLNGYDIIICSDADGNTKLDHEIESYNHETGAVIFHFREPSVSHEANTTFYVFVGNSSVTTSQENVTGVWNANFKAVYHWVTHEGVDSTGQNSLNDDCGGGGGSETAGVIDGGTDLTVNETCRRLATPDMFSGTGARTTSKWIKLASTGQTDLWLGGLGRNLGADRYYWIVGATYGLGVECRNGYAVAAWTEDTSWHLWHVTYPAGGTVTDIKIYKDGQPMTVTGTSGTCAPAIGEPFTTGGLYGWGFGALHTSDEERISNVAFTADWILTEFNNQSDPATFFTSDGVFEEPATSDIKAVSTVPLAGIGKIAGVAIADVAKVAGVANQ